MAEQTELNAIPYYRIRKDGEIVEDSILCRRKSDGKIGRYDFVSKKFSEILNDDTKDRKYR